ncbi:MAG: Na/Pi symporter [Candidatus Kaelpia imicola]|nr:Na/Pi symporter [Candidatus Kaelpia imicola]
MKTEALKTLFKIVLVAFFLYLFLLSIGLMSVAFKGFGRGFAESLIQTTSNPLAGLFIGILATSIVQSSSMTTSIIVGMVGSGVITVTNAIPIIMGANIGTTVTNTLVSLGHIGRREEFKRAVSAGTVHDFFNLICVAILFPLHLMTGFLEKMARFMSHIFAGCGGIRFTSPVKMVTKPVINIMKEAVVNIGLSSNISYLLLLISAFFLLFLALYFIVKIMRSVVVRRAEIILNNVISRYGLLAILAGLIFTTIVQSSSITTSLMIPLAAAGVLTVEGVLPIVMGANIGTTTTAILASFATGNISAITIAFVHFLFNVIGVTLIYPIKPLRRIPMFLSTHLGSLAYRRRRYVIFYVLTMFFIIPGILIAMSKFF